MLVRAKILRLIKSNDIKLVYTEKEIIEKMKQKDKEKELSTIKIKNEILYLKKIGEIYENKEGYLMATNITSK